MIQTHQLQDQEDIDFSLQGLFRMLFKYELISLNLCSWMFHLNMECDA